MAAAAAATASPAAVTVRRREAAGRLRAEPGRGAPAALGARAVPSAPPASSSGSGTRIEVWVSRLESGRDPRTSGTAPRREAAWGARRSASAGAPGNGACGASGSSSGSTSSTSSAGIPASSGSTSRSRSASSAARSREAGALDRHCTISRHSSSGIPGSGTTVSVTCRRSTAPGCPPPNGVNPASSS